MLPVGPVQPSECLIEFASGCVYDSYVKGIVLCVMFFQVGQCRVGFGLAPQSIVGQREARAGRPRDRLSLSLRTLLADGRVDVYQDRDRASFD